MSESEEYLTLKNASEYCSLPEKYFRNYVMKGKEIESIKRRGRWMVLRSEVEKWKTEREWRIVDLTLDDYLKAFEFATKLFYQGGPGITDWGGRTRRDIGKFLTNQIEGKLGELALAKFLLYKFNVELKLDFTIRQEIPSQDIVEVIRIHGSRRVSNPPRLRVSVKTTKMQNFALPVPRKELEDELRRSDVYIMCRVELPLDHLLRVFKNHSILLRMRNVIPELDEIKAEVVGYAWREELQNKGITTEIRGGQKITPSYVMYSGELHSSKEEWEVLVNLL